jgi:hypothetical protein
MRVAVLADIHGNLRSMRPWPPATPRSRSTQPRCKSSKRRPWPIQASTRSQSHLAGWVSRSIKMDLRSLPHHHHGHRGPSAGSARWKLRAKHCPQREGDLRSGTAGDTRHQADPGDLEARHRLRAAWSHDAMGFGCTSQRSRLGRRQRVPGTDRGRRTLRRHRAARVRDQRR